MFLAPPDGTVCRVSYLASSSRAFCRYCSSGFVGSQSCSSKYEAIFCVTWWTQTIEWHLPPVRRCLPKGSGCSEAYSEVANVSSSSSSSGTGQRRI